MKQVTVELLPLDRKIETPAGTLLQDLLFEHGVEFPCGGRGLCKGCKVKVLAGSLPVTVEDRKKLSPAEIDQGWRLACQAAASADLCLELEQWEAPILGDDSLFQFTPREGLGIAIDLGTTTVVAQLVDLQHGHVLGVRSTLNCQAKHGADIMTRIEFAVTERGQHALMVMIRAQIAELCLDLSKKDPRPIRDIVMVGNTVMHHLFCGIDVEPLSHVPFEPLDVGLKTFAGEELGWSFLTNTRVHFLPCLGGFVGSDILAGIIATSMHDSDRLVALMDLGTNGEIVVGNRDRLLCASTAAGPAFEGARISMGMRAATGAISEVQVQLGQLRCHVLGNGAPRGICGSGLVDAAAASLDLGLLLPSGRIANGQALDLVEPVRLNQWDIRELQLAKGAIAAGMRILLNKLGAGAEDLERLYLAGAFGNYINQASARRIGLLQFPPDKIEPAGNTALLGAKMALFHEHPEKLAYRHVQNKTQQVSLHEDPVFQETYVEEMGFPAQ